MRPQAIPAAAGLLVIVVAAGGAAVHADPAAFRQADENGRQANEAFHRCHRFVEGWLRHADPKTGLIPRNLGPDTDIWNPWDAAADNYPFMVLTAAITDRPLFDGRMLDMLHTETKLTSRLDRLPDVYSFSKQGFRDEKLNLDQLIFGGTEYAKDGLMPLTEWLGPSPWSQRMIGIVDDIWKHAPVPTPFGAIPSTSQEVNGECMQVLARLFFMTGQRKYLDWGLRLADYYLLDGHHPTRDEEVVRFRDHGCETLSGLSEIYLAASFAAPEKKTAYEGPIHRMFDRCLEIGRNEHGLFYNAVNTRTGKPAREGLCDTWGYTYNGIYTVYLIDKTATYRDAVRKVLSNLNGHYRDHAWGPPSVLSDELADSIESGINLFNREPVPSAAEWIDYSIRRMFAIQKPDGVIEGWHGDGNFARTAIMYALWKTQGLTIRPWRKDVRFGAVRKDGMLYVSLTADAPWQGKLLFDIPRHKVNLKLPLDYPRINHFPEWFTVDAEAEYKVTIDGKTETHMGRELAAGLPIELKGDTSAVRLSVKR
ncbi:MAG: hypothetical protein ACPMAQ_00795 [Phycisphaerae bacterium]